MRVVPKLGMGKQATRKELTPAEITKVQGTIESFQQRWGMELTAMETSRIVERATDAILQSKGEINISPVVRDQMFSLLIKKDPGRAIEFRMDMLEKQGKDISDEKREGIVGIAQNEGWRAAREALREATKESRETGKRREPAPGAVAGARRAAAPPREEAAAVAEASTAGHKDSRGLTLEQLLDSAELHSRKLASAGEDYNGWKEHVVRLRASQLEIFGRKNPGAAEILGERGDVNSPQYRAVLAEFESYLEKKNSPASRTRREETERRHFSVISGLKDVRDDLIARAVLAAGGTQEQANQLANLRSEGVTRGLHQDQTMGNQAMEFGTYGVQAVSILRAKSRQG